MAAEPTFEGGQPMDMIGAVELEIYGPRDEEQIQNPVGGPHGDRPGCDLLEGSDRKRAEL